VVKFNEGGLGTITFSKDQIEKFDLKGWNDPVNLQLKLVLKAGEWNTMDGAYSPVGNNTIRASAIQRDGSVTVDLSMMDHAPGDVRMGENSYIAYEIDPDKARVLQAGGEPVPYSKFLVIHNSGNTAATVSTPMVNDPSNWVVLLDASGADANGLKNPIAKVKAGLTVVPMKSSLILGRRH
jgi:hypothetical protein